MSAFPHVRIGDICKLINGKAFKPEDWSTSGVPIIRIQNLNDTAKPFNYWDGPLDRQVRIKPNDVLFAWSGTPGTSFGAHIWHGPAGILNQHIFLVELNSRIITKDWWVHTVNNQISELIGLAHGGVGLKHVTRRMIDDMLIPLPPLAEQKRIAAILDQADDLRRKRQRALDRLGQLGQAIFMEMFGENEPTYIPLSEYFEEIRMGPFGSLLHKFDYIEGGIPLINPTHISAGEILPDLNFSITQSKAKELEIYRLRSGDLIIGRRGEMGRCAVVKDEHDGFLCGTGSMILRAARGKIDPFFLSELIRSRKVVERIEAVASGVTMMNLNSKSFDRVMVPKISLDQQKEYFRRVEYLAILRPSMEIGLSNLVSLFASLQHRAFRGEL